MAEYPVQPRDKASLIAKRYGISLEELQKLNPRLKKNPDRIYIGENLVVPDRNEEAGLDSVSFSRTSKSPVTPPKSQADGQIRYTIKPGDKLIIPANIFRTFTNGTIPLSMNEALSNEAANPKTARPSTTRFHESLIRSRSNASEISSPGYTEIQCFLFM